MKPQNLRILKSKANAREVTPVLRLQHRKYFDWVSVQLGINKQEDWYQITGSSLKQYAGDYILHNYYKGSLIRALPEIYPEFEWQKFRFVQRQRNFFSSVQHRREYMNWFAEQLQINTQEDWYQIRSQDALAYGLFFVQDQFGGSMRKCLMDVYPEFIWNEWKFLHVSQGTWTESSNHRIYFDWLGKQLGIQQLDDWYKVNTAQLFDSGAGGLLTSKYSGSYVNALMAAYPEHDWYEWKFNKVSNGFWRDKDNQKKYFTWLAKQLNIRKLEQWYRVTVDMVGKRNGGGLLKVYSYSLRKALKSVFPEYDWDKHYNISAGQNIMWKWLSSLLLEDAVLLNYKHTKLMHDKSNRYMELDLYIPSLQLAFEYHGGQHFVEYFGNAPFVQQQRDEEKRRACAQLGISLISVPYWWTNSPERLISTIKKYRPDVKIKPFNNLNRHSTFDLIEHSTYKR